MLSTPARNEIGRGKRAGVCPAKARLCNNVKQGTDTKGVDMLPLVAAFVLINPSPLAKAAEQFRAMTGIGVLYNYAELGHVQVNEVECGCGPVEAMRRMLWGTHAWIAGIHRNRDDGRIETFVLTYRPCLFKPEPDQSWMEARCET